MVSSQYPGRGDFLSELEEIQATVSSLAGRGVRGQMVQILDPAEESLPFSGRVRFAGFEGEGQTLLGRVENIRVSYRERLARHREAIGEIARRAGWGFIIPHTDRPPQTALLPLYTAMAGASDRLRR